MSDTYRKTPPAANGTVDALLAGHGKTAKLGLYLALGGLGLFLLFLLLLHSPVVLILAILLVVAGLIVRSIAVGKMKTVAAGSLIPEALSTVLEQVRYDAKSRISDNVVCHTDMGFPFDFDEIKGGDYVSGVYRGLRMEMSDLELVDVRRIHTKNGTRTQRVTVFRGQWIICQFGRELSADVRLSERGALGQLFAAGGVKTENDAFNKRFFIQSTSQHDVFYLLTPHMMERVLHMDALANGDSYLRFGRDGRVHIAVATGRNLFEVGADANAEALREKFRSEIRSVTQLLDALCLPESMSQN